MHSLSHNTITLPWEKNAAEFWFSSLNNQPWSMLLHSGGADHQHSRFDIIVADPISWIETYGSISIIKTLQNTITYSKKDPLILLSNILRNTRFCSYYHPDFPFRGGAMGIFGYDLCRRFERLPEKAIRDIYLPDMAVGIYDWALIIDNFKKRVSLFSYTDPYIRLAWLNIQHSTEKRPFKLISGWRSNMTKKQYDEKFLKVQSYLYDGDCYQINLAQRFQAEYKGNEWPVFCKLNAKNRAPFSAFLRLRHGAILSFSPERFIHLADGNIQTRPIKGTLPRLEDFISDHQQGLKLFLSSKNRAENLMIVDLMRNDISRVAKLGSVLVPELFVVEVFPAVHHLVSTITAQLSSSYNACSLLRVTFPGGSITGAPKVRAMEIIDELEPHRRNAWCGSIGYLSLCGTMDTNIAIRTLIACNNTLYCSAGGGIVADSLGGVEYQETLDKIIHILQFLESDL